MLRSQRQARRPQQRTDSTPHDRGIFKDRAHLPCAIAGFAAYLHNEYSQPSVFLAPAKLGRVPSEPTFEIEARPRRRRPRATRTQCACAPRSRAALHVAPHSGGTRLCIHSNGTLHLIHLTQRGHLAYAPLHTPQLRNYPRLHHYVCRHPDPAPSHTPCHCPQSARTRRDETRPQRAISGSPTSPSPSRSAARRREAPNDAAKLRRSSFHSYLHSRANLRSPADPGRICYIPVRSKGRRRPRRSERTVPPTPLHAA